MKFLKSFRVTLVTILCLGIVSCGDDNKDENLQNPLLGIWYSELEEGKEGDFGETIFTEDNKIIEKVFYDGDYQDIFEGNYSINSDILTVTTFVHKERTYNDKWIVTNDTSTVSMRFRVVGDTLKTSSLEKDEFEIHTRKKR